MTDGACSGNGRKDARSGIGAYWSTRQGTNYSSPVTNEHDPDAPRTNQRAELLAAIYGIRKFARERSHKQAFGVNRNCWVLATDSKYVVDGITDWLPRWKVWDIHHIYYNQGADALFEEESNEDI